jgi:hypothetical protein
VGESGSIVRTLRDGKYFHWFVGEPSAPLALGLVQPFTPVVTMPDIREPTTWVTLLLGLFGLGAVLRRQRRTVSLTT